MINTFFTLAQAPGGSPVKSLIMMGLFFVIMWVIMIRPQQKRAKALKLSQASLKKGDKVVTIGGMHASVNSVSETTVSLRISEGVFVKYDRSAIAKVISKDAPQEEEK